MKNKCLVEGCEKPVAARKMCMSHYRRFMKTGSVEFDRMIRGEVLIYLASIAETDTSECLSMPNHDVEGWYKSIVYKGKFTKAHRVMCEIAHGKAPTKRHVAMHLCNNKGCLNPKHLTWGTQKQNAEHAAECGLVERGADKHMAKLSEADVSEIRRRYDDGEVCSEIAKDFPVGKSNIWAVAVGKTWAHVQSAP